MTRSATRLASLVLLLAVTVGTADAFESVDDPRLWAITGLAIIDLETGEVVPDQTIVIRNGVITAVGERETVLADADAIVIDYPGHYAIPGLWDMHVHIRGGPRLIDANERWLRQYLGFGVTAIRDTGGDLPGSVLHWKDSIAQGFVYGPRIFTSLRKLDGAVAGPAGALAVDSSASIDAALDYLELAGADFVKLYYLSLREDLYPLIIRKAGDRGLRTAAHMPASVPFEELIDAGLDSIEHSFFLGKAANPNDRALSRRFAEERTLDFVVYFAQLAELADGADIDRARTVFRSMARSGTAITPVMEIDREIYAFLKGDSIENARLAETPALIRETHDLSAESMAVVVDDYLPSHEKIMRTGFELTRIAGEEGVMLLAGSDTGADNPFVYPGDSLHAELALMVEIGLSPLAALRAATIDAARWMGLDRDFGELTADRLADLVILESNPLDDIANTRSIAAVVQQGVLFDRAELDELRQLVGD